MGRLLFILTAPLLLASCLLTPGRFNSTLDIRADRSFTFTYAGEAIIADPEAAMAEGMSMAMSKEDQHKIGAVGQSNGQSKTQPETEATIAKRRAIAEVLAREIGYRSVAYLGGGKYQVDYSISGRLDRSFVFPYNPDGSAIIPWLAIEVRKDGTARVSAQAFGQQSDQTAAAAVPSSDDAIKDRRGSFTLTTDATLVMQNNEAGVAPGPGTRVVWEVDPTSKTVPTAVVRFAN